MDLAATPSSFDLRNGPCAALDMATKAHVHSSAELRLLAARWRSEPLGEDAERAERVARTLEWVAEQRERRRQPHPRHFVGRLAIWLPTVVLNAAAAAAARTESAYGCC